MSIRGCATLIVCFVLGAGTARADDGPPVILHAAHVFTGETLLGPSWVFVDKGRVAEISSTPLTRGNARVVELTGMTLLPGLIDTHVHLLLQDGVAPAIGRMILLRETSAQKALRGLGAAERLLQAGFTTIRVVGDFDVAHAHLDVRDAIAAGLFLGPKIYAAAHFITRTGGHYDDNWVAQDQHIAPWARVADGPTELVEAVRDEVKVGADWIKIAGSGGNTTPGSLPQLSSFADEELVALVNEAHRLKRKVAAHAHAAPALTALIRAGVDSIEHGTELSADQLRDMARRGIYWVPTLYRGGGDPSEPDGWLDEWRKSPLAATTKPQMKSALAKGVQIAFGTDTGLYPHGEGNRMFALLVEAGMTPRQALRTATVNAAKMLGDADAGSVAVGRRADLVAVPGNPLENIRLLEAVQFVMVHGTIVRETSAP